MFFYVQIIHLINAENVYWIYAMEYARHFGAYKIISLKQIFFKMLNIKVGEMAYQ